MMCILFTVYWHFSLALLGNQYLHETSNGNILRFDAETGTSSVVLLNTTIVC